jgi:GlpG protein
MKRDIVSFDSSFTLCLILVSFIVTLIQETFVPGFAHIFATHNKWDIGIVLHIFGHSSWSHFLGNVVYIAMLGPSVEETFGSIPLMIMTLLSAVFIGIVSVIFKNPCYGLSSIAYMWVILNTFQINNSKKIPLTSIILLVIFVLPEVIAMFVKSDNIGHQNHVLGAIFGLVFGIAAKAIYSTKNELSEQL